MANDLEKLTAVLARCSKHIVSFISYINAAAANPPHEYYIEGLEDLNSEGVELERTLSEAMQPVLNNIIVGNPDVGALLAANLAYVKLVILGISSANIISKSSVLDKLLGSKPPKPIDPTKL